MRREGTLETFSDGKLYEKDDRVKADCLECMGCSDCCHGMGNTVQLDPLDIHRLKKKLGIDFEGLLQEKKVELTLADTFILPSLKINEKKDSCVFLNEYGRCSIHDARPGICRLFPLGRYYHDRRFSYFLQIHECSMKERREVKVCDWMDTPKLDTYEEFVTNWHYLLKDLEEWIQKNGEENRNQMATTILQFFYASDYGETTFYEEYFSKAAKFRNAFGIA